MLGQWLKQLDPEVFDFPDNAMSYQDLFTDKSKLDNLVFKLDSFGDFEVESHISDDYTEYSENGGGSG